MSLVSHKYVERKRRVWKGAGGLWNYVELQILVMFMVNVLPVDGLTGISMKEVSS